MSSLDEVESTSETVYPCIIDQYEFDLPIELIDQYPDSMPYVMFHSPLQAARKRRGRWVFEYPNVKLFYDTMQALVKGTIFKQDNLVVLSYLNIPYYAVRLRDFTSSRQDDYTIHASNSPNPSNTQNEQTEVRIPRPPPPRYSYGYSIESDDDIQVREISISTFR